MSGQAKVTVHVSIAWWLKPYLWALIFFCLLHDRQPDQEKLQRVLMRAIRLRFR